MNTNLVRKIGKSAVKFSAGMCLVSYGTMVVKQPESFWDERCNSSKNEKKVINALGTIIIASGAAVSVSSVLDVIDAVK